MLGTSLRCKEVEFFTFCKTTILTFPLITTTEGCAARFNVVWFLFPLIWPSPMDAEEVWHHCNLCCVSAFWHICPCHPWGLSFRLKVWDLSTALSLCLYCLSEEQPSRYGAASVENKTIARDCTNLLLPLNCQSLNERIHPAHCKGSLGKLRLNTFLFFLTVCGLGLRLHCCGPKQVTPLAVQNWD